MKTALTVFVIIIAFAMNSTAAELPALESKSAKKLLKHPQFRKALAVAPEFTMAVLKELDKYAPKESLEELAEKGNARAQAWLAWEYTYGENGRLKNPELAFQWAKKAAAKESTIGEFILGRSYSMGTGTPKDAEEAFKWYRKAAEKGFNAAQNNLGNMYLSGEGVLKDEEEAMKWYRKAAEPLKVEFEKNLTAKQSQQAIVALNDNTERARLIAQHNIGLNVFIGQGVEKNTVRAVEWMRKSAEGGYVNAQFNLGIMYRAGDGFPKDLITAHAWFSIAAFQSHNRADEAITELGKVMTRDDIIKAQALSRTIIKKNPKVLRSIR